MRVVASPPLPGPWAWLLQCSTMLASREAGLRVSETEMERGLEVIDM